MEARARHANGGMLARMKLLAPLFATVVALGCNPPSSPAAKADPATASTPPAKVEETGTKALASAQIGQPAPDFALKDYDGKEVRLSALRGKTVVLEWFNPDCPFVKAAHGKGSLKTLAKKHADKGVVWLGVNSSGPGKQGNAPERVAAGKKAFALEHPILVDESGQVGKQYGATNTPHMYVIDPQGVLVYRGAIDNSPDGEGESPTGGKLVNYVDAALEDLAAGRAVTTKETRAYGCGVKYGS